MLGNGLFEKCVRLINEWEPKKEYPKEEKYRDDLRLFLMKNLNKQEQDLFSNQRDINVKI
mgnify:CR=1 FL=1